MTFGFDAGVATQGIYAALLGVGGLIGYLKAGSKASLIAGSVSAVLALASMGLALAGYGRAGFGMGLVLAIAMTMSFGSRYRKSHKFMPSGMLGILSVVVAVILGIVMMRAS